MVQLGKYDFLKKNVNSKMGNRILAEIGYAHKLSKAKGGIYDDLNSRVIDFLMDKMMADGAITDKTALDAEEMLAVISEEAGKFTIMCVAHAHIDMNWMWDYPETVAITTDTFRTVLGLMKDFPEFKFSQSQASVYRIIEEHEPEMLTEIRKRVCEGRWEAVASSWVEADKNMTSGESQARHVLYTKRYLENLLDIEPDSIQVDFEPDTFGHSANVPEILSKGGIKYYYHCRGYDGYNVYNWKAASGSSLLVYREPVWYNEKIDSDMALFVPEFCSANGIDTLLKVYGVGDHGGGPTRRDLERLMEMKEWPVFPRIRFGTYSEFFNELETKKDSFPEVTGELNFVFTGCYTSQSRIKKANKLCENRLVDSEVLCSMAAVNDNFKYDNRKFFRAWEKVMFNQFHDILPGSGVIDTREFAMGYYQSALATSNSEASAAIRKMCNEIDTSWIAFRPQEISETNSEGAGVGFGLDHHKLPSSERGKGIDRIRYVFNPTQYKWNGVIETTLWDWEGDLERLVVKDHLGNEVLHQVLDKKGKDYWAHIYSRLLLKVDVPAFGYASYHITQRDMKDIPVNLPAWERLMDEDSFVLENDKISARFNSVNLSLQSLYDKKSAKDLIDSSSNGGGFNLVNEDATKGMSSWVVGRYKKVTRIGENFVVIDRYIDPGALRQWITFKGCFSDSSLKVTVSLDRDSTTLVYDTECDWHEKAEHKITVQQLNFSIPLACKCLKYKYDIPFGTIDRRDLEHDVPALNFATAVFENGGLSLVSADRYGFRGHNDTLAITLIRNSTNPDPHPESGINRFRFGIVSVNETGSFNLIKIANNFNHQPVAVSGIIKKGSKPPVAEYLYMAEGEVCITALKMSEDNIGEMVVRLYEPKGEAQKVKITFNKEPVKAFFTDVNENTIGKTIKTTENSIIFEIGACCIETLKVEF